jgi:predicted metal-binding protein
VSSIQTIIYIDKTEEEEEGGGGGGKGIVIFIRKAVNESVILHTYTHTYTHTFLLVVTPPSADNFTRSSSSLLNRTTSYCNRFSASVVNVSCLLICFRRESVAVNRFTASQLLNGSIKLETLALRVFNSS